MTFNAQELNQRITLQQQYSAVNPMTGISTTEWQDRISLWAKAEGAVGRTLFTAAAAGYVDPVNFTIRYIEVEGDSGSGIAPLRPGDWRIVWRGMVYTIESIIDIKGKRREMVISAQGTGTAV